MSIAAFHVGCGGVVQDSTAQAQGTGAAGSAGQSAGGSSAGSPAGAAGATTGAAGATTGTTGAGGSPGAGGGTSAAGAGGAATTGTGGSGAGGAAGGDPGGAGGDTGFVTAAHEPYPQMGHGAQPLLKAVQLVTITYDGYDQKDHVEAFGDYVVQSEWLATVGADYGAGKGAHVAKVVLPGPAPATISNSGITKLLKASIASGDIPAPPATANDYLYMFYFPKTTIVTQGGPVMGTCATQGFGGYHDATSLNGARLAFAAIPGCQSPQSMEVSASHEIIEAVTDPNPGGGYMFKYTELWGAPAGGEVGDACNDLLWKEGGFTLQRSWSNSAAAAGKEPCVPVNPDLGAFGVAPDQTGVIGVPVGGTATVVLTGWSEKEIGNWSLGKNEYGTNDFIATTKFSSTLINNGFVSNMTITVPKTAAKGSYDAFFITSTYMGETHLWPIAVQAQLRRRGPRVEPRPLSRRATTHNCRACTSASAGTGRGTGRACRCRRRTRR
jgi:hypothetical protein